MVRDGIPFVVVPIVLTIIPLFFGFWWAAIPLLLIAAFMAYFFRNPRRSIPLTPGIVVAPADGRVTLVRPADDKNPQSLVSIEQVLLRHGVEVFTTPTPGCRLASSK